MNKGTENKTTRATTKTIILNTVTTKITSTNNKDDDNNNTEIMEGMKDAIEQDLEEHYCTLEEVQWIIDNPLYENNDNITYKANQTKMELLKENSRDEITEI